MRRGKQTFMFHRTLHWLGFALGFLGILAAFPAALMVRDVLPEMHHAVLLTIQLFAWMVATSVGALPWMLCEERWLPWEPSLFVMRALHQVDTPPRPRLPGFHHPNRCAS